MVLDSANTSLRRPAKQGTALPHDLEAEASILGGIVVKPAILSALSTLEIDDFYHNHHKVVFEAVRNLEAAHVPIDVVTLEAEIRRRGKLEAIGGIAFLGELALRVPTIDNVIAYTKIVRDLAMMRRLALKAARVLERVSTWEYQPDEFLGETLRDFQDVERGYREAGERIPLISVGSALEQIDRLARTPIYQTPFPELNKALGFGGLLGGQVYTVVSGTGAGKTSWVSTVGEHHATHLGDVLIATWEMIPGYFVARIAAKHLKVHSNQILRGEVRWGAVQDVVPRRMEFLERPSLATLRRAIEQVTRSGRPPPLVIVDYIQALADDIAATMVGQTRAPDTRQINALVSRELVKIAKETGAPLLVVSATARMTAQKLVNDVRKVSPRDLVGAAKETSQIEYDGAALIVLSLSDEHDLDGQIATMSVSKSRFGETCHIDGRYDGGRGGWIEIGRVAIVPKAEGATAAASAKALREAIARTLKQAGPLQSKTKIWKLVGRKKESVFSEIDAMLDDGSIVLASGKMALPIPAQTAPVTSAQTELAVAVPEVGA